MFTVAIIGQKRVTPPLVKYCTLRAKEGLKVPVSGKLYTAPLVASYRELLR